MKKIMFILVMMLVAIMAISVASAAPEVQIERKDGQFIFVGQTNDVINYMMNMDRQSLLDLAIIDRGEGAFYARILEEDEILLWSNGEEVSAYNITLDADSYRVLQNELFLVEDENGEVTPNYLVETKDVASLRDDYVAFAYNKEHEALNEGATLAESYPIAQPWDDLVIRNAEEQEIFKALVVGYRYDDARSDYVYFVAWKFWHEPAREVVVPVKPTPAPTKAPDKTPDPTKRPDPTPTPKPTPENNPRPTEPSGADPTPENNPRPTEPTGSGVTASPEEREHDPLPVTPPPTTCPENNRPSESEGTSENHRPTQEEIESGRLENGEAVGHGQVSTDPDPMTSGGSVTPENNPVRPTEEEIERGRLSNGEAVGYGQVSHDPDPMTGGASSGGSNSGCPHESGGQSSGTTSGGEATGSGVSAGSDEDPFG